MYLKPLQVWYSRCAKPGAARHKWAYLCFHSPSQVYILLSVKSSAPFNFHHSSAAHAAKQPRERCSLCVSELYSPRVAAFVFVCLRVSDLLTSERSKRPSPYPFYCPPPPYLTTVTGESALPFRLLQTAKTSIPLRWDGWAKQRRESVSHCSAHWWASKWRCSGKLAR